MFYTFSAGVDFRRQILTYDMSKVGPRAGTVKELYKIM